jgi:ArsR family transcriptional regulator
MGEVESLSSVLKVIAEPNRLRVLCILQTDGSYCVCELEAHMPEVSQSLLSHHLADLRAAGLVQSEKEGLKVYYSLTHKGKHITQTVLSLTKKEHHAH